MWHSASSTSIHAFCSNAAQWSNADGRLEPLTVAASLDTFPPFHVAKLEMEFAAGQGMPSLGDAVECIRLETVHEPGFSPPPTTHSFVFDRTAYASIADMLSAFQSALQAMDPDVLLTAGGDQRWFPWLVEQSEVHGRSLALGGQQNRFSNPPINEQFTRTGRRGIDTGRSFSTGVCIWTSRTVSL